MRTKTTLNSLSLNKLIVNSKTKLQKLIIMDDTICQCLLNLY